MFRHALLYACFVVTTGCAHVQRSWWRNTLHCVFHQFMEQVARLDYLSSTSHGVHTWPSAVVHEVAFSANDSGASRR